MKSQLDAKTYGIGQLITQRKMFAVPEHQRNFAWTQEEVDQFLTDVSGAAERNAPDYFIGLIVIRGPVDSVWQILDGQQRLATTIMIYSAIRDWLLNEKLKADAEQIENEFIGVRQLGGKYYPRLRLNTENQTVFERYVINTASDNEIFKELEKWPKRSTNNRLLECVLFCRRWITEFAKKKSTDKDGQSTLYSLAAFFETRVKVVCVEVTSDTDAYILFESLNDRGADLSALDLVKNYIFSRLQNVSLDSLDADWKRLIENIEDKDADDFLKVFWTSQFGIIRKIDLFDQLTRAYHDKKGAQDLIKQLVEASEMFGALDDFEHELWNSYGWICRLRIQQLKIFGNRQARPLILSALRKFSVVEIEAFLWLLIVIVVRYQLIGRGRPGNMEKIFADLSRKIHDGKINTAAEAHSELKQLLPDDEIFKASFERHSETNGSRAQLLLLDLEATSRSQKGNFKLNDYMGLRSFASNLILDFVAMSFPDILIEDEHRRLMHMIGNRFLIENTNQLPAEHLFDTNFKDTLQKSSMFLTQEVTTYSRWSKDQVAERSRHLAELAAKTWIFSNPLFNSRP